MNGKLIFWLLAGVLIMATLSGELLAGFEWRMVGRLPPFHKANDIWSSGRSQLIAGCYIALDDLSLKEMNRRRPREEAFISRNFVHRDRWEGTYRGRGGIIRIAPRSDKSLIALGLYHHDNGECQSYFLISTDMGQSWRAFATFRKHILGIASSAGPVVWAWSSHDLFEIEIYGGHWEQCKTFARIITANGPQPVLDKFGNIWLPQRDHIIKITGMGTEVVFKLPFDFMPDRMALNQDGQLWVIGRSGKNSNENTRLYKLAGEKMTMLAKLPHFLANTFYVKDEAINIFATTVKTIPPENFLFYSRDGGNTWKTEACKMPDTSGPAFFEDSDTLWMVGTYNRVFKALME